MKSIIIGLCAGFVLAGMMLLLSIPPSKSSFADIRPFSISQSGQVVGHSTLFPETPQSNKKLGASRMASRPTVRQPGAPAEDNLYFTLAYDALITAHRIEHAQLAPVIMSRTPERIKVSYSPPAEMREIAAFRNGEIIVYIDPKTNTVTHIVGEAN